MTHGKSSWVKIEVEYFSREDQKTADQLTELGITPTEVDTKTGFILVPINSIQIAQFIDDFAVVNPDKCIVSFGPRKYVVDKSVDALLEDINGEVKLDLCK